MTAEHAVPGSGNSNGAVTFKFVNESYGKAYSDNTMAYTSDGHLVVGPGVVDISKNQYRNRGNTVIGNGGSTDIVSFADYEAKLLFDKSNAASTSNSSVVVNGWYNRNYWTAVGFGGVGTYGLDASALDGQTVFVQFARNTLFSGDEVIPDGTAVTFRGDVQQYAANTLNNTYYIRTWFDDGPVVGDDLNSVYCAVYTNATCTTPLTYNDLVASPGTYVYPASNGNGKGIFEFSSKPAQGLVNVGASQWSTSGSGANTKFVAHRFNGSYLDINFLDPMASYGGPNAPAPGDGHVVGDTITISGANLKGIATTNNVTFTVDSIDGSGGIATIGNITGTAYQLTNAQWSMEMDQTTDNLYVKDDGTTKFTFTPNGAELKQFNETVVALGNQSGNISASINAVNGSIFTLTATGGITFNSIPNAQAGSSYTIKVTQDGTGSHALTSTMKFAGGDKTLSTAGGSIDVINVVYDGTHYLATLSKAYA